MDDRILQLEQEMDRTLNYDALTKLPFYNRFATMAKEYIEANTAKDLYCVYSDFSNFQCMNDVYGYETGDMVLREFAESLVKDYADGILFCRVTSDHFLGFLKAESQEKAYESYLQFTEQFTENVNNRFVKCNLVIASGMYKLREGESNVAAMMDNANEARKKCKEQRVITSVVIFTEEIRKQIESTKNIMANMVNAYNNREFYAYLQPKVSLKTGKIVGAEALVRWIRPDGSRIFPNEFIGIFEKNGFITKVDFLVLEQVLEYLHDAKQKGEDFVPISVNFSRRHIEFKEFVPNIIKRLEKYKIPGELLEAELTESLFSADMASLEQNVKNMREHRIKVSVDDFGSGYSSLSLLPRVEVDVVKLDKQFLDTTLSADQEENSLTVIKYLIKMLKHLGFEVLAEGVETKEQLEMLKRADCDLVQGYYYAKPMPIPEFREFLKEFNNEHI